MQTMTITPDLQTRESVMAAAGRVQFAVRDLATDQVRYVKIEAKVKKDGGQGYERGTRPLDEATHVFISEKGYGSPSLGTYYPPKPGYQTGRFFGQQSDTPPPALDIAIAFIEGRPLIGYEVDAESRCGLCGHKLRDKGSIERGIGPECMGKPTGTKILAASAFAPEGADPAGALINLVKQSQIEAMQDRREDLIREIAKMDQDIAALQNDLALQTA